MFPEIREIVDDESTKDEENKIKLSIPNVNTIFSELNKRNISQELKFVMSGDELLDEALKRFGHLNACTCAFLNYLSSPSKQDLLQINKIIHLGSGDIFNNENNSKEIIYYFLSAHEDNTKLSMEIEYAGLEDWHFYVNDCLANTTNDKFDMLMHVNLQFLFHNFNNYQNLIGEETYKIKHAIIVNDNYTLEKMQSKNWPYFIERLIEISEGDITAIDFSGTQNNFNEIKILKNSKYDLSICKDYYNKIYNNIGHHFAEYLKTLPETLINEIEKH